MVGQTSVVVGTGAIGQEIGWLCDAVGLTTIGVRNTAAATLPLSFAAATYSEIAAVLPRADWLISPAR